jgi:hypothetical protein
MDPIQKEKIAGQPREEDVDLGVLLYKTGRAINRFFILIGKGFQLIGRALLIGVLFLRRNFLWLLLGTVIGLAYGIYLNTIRGSDFYARATVRTNFGSARALYSSMDYLNALIGGGDTAELSRVFSITPAEAASLAKFEASPVKDEFTIAESYRENFLRFKTEDPVRMDTFWSKTLKYADFKKNLTQYDYLLHEIIAVSNSRTVFPKLQQGLINLVSRNQVLQNNKALTAKTLSDQENIILSSIQGLDSLRSTYNRLLLQQGSREGGPNINFFDKSAGMNSPELDLYDKLLVMNEELRNSRERSALNQEIIQVYSPFNSRGNKQGLLKQSFLQYSIIGFSLTFILLLILAINKELARIESKSKK